MTNLKKKHLNNDNSEKVKSENGQFQKGIFENDNHF